MNVKTQTLRKIIYFVFNDQTETIASFLRSEINKSCADEVVVCYENVDDPDYLDTNQPPFYDEPITIINMVNYFPESYDLDQEHHLSHTNNVSLLESLKFLYHDSLMINISINNSLFLALSDRINDGKIEAFVQSKIEQLYTLKKCKHWINIECGLVVTDELNNLIYDNSDQTFLLNSTVPVNPLSIDDFTAAIISIINSPDNYVDSNIQLVSKDNKTMFSFFKSKLETPKLLEYVDFIEELPSYQTYVKRFH